MVMPRPPRAQTSFFAPSGDLFPCVLSLLINDSRMVGIGVGGAAQKRNRRQFNEIEPGKRWQVVVIFAHRPQGLLFGIVIFRAGKIRARRRVVQRPCIRFRASPVSHRFFALCGFRAPHTSGNRRRFRPVRPVALRDYTAVGKAPGGAIRGPT